MNSNTRFNKIFENNYLLHTIVWVLLFSIPYLLSYDNPDVLFRMLEHAWLSLFMYGVLFYLNYFLLIDKLLFKKKNGAFFIVNIIAVAVLAIVLFEVKRYLHQDFERDEVREMMEVMKLPRPPQKVFIYRDVLALLIPIVFAYTLKLVSKLKKAEAKRVETEKVKLSSELKYLKNQLQPHFFFNTINNIYSLIDIDTNDAKESLHKLSKLMRYLLYNTSEDTVLLKDEVDFLSNYIDLMKLRVGDNVDVKVDLKVPEQSIKIPPMLFLTLVENCFKHGIDAIQPSYISLKLIIEDDKIIFKTINPFFPSKHNSEKNKVGIGLENLKQRLELIYPQKYSLIAEQKEGVFVSELKIQENEL